MDLIGKRFGKLLVLGNAEKKGYVNCKCDCGETKNIRATTLTRKKAPTKSCGCLQKEIAKSIGLVTIAHNSEKQIDTNIKYNTNFQVIETQAPPKNNTSGYKGVSWNSSRQLWEVYINVHKRRIHLGRYKEYDDAVRIRQKAEDEYFRPLIEAKKGECVNG